MEKRITIFTPTFNRKLTLKRLYDSLCNQESKQFIWLIIDDGSTDCTNLIVQKWILEGYVDIHYFYQANQGKSTAFNVALDKIKTELFLGVDSDDYLVPTTITLLLKTWDFCQSGDYTGIIAFKGYSENNPITRLTNSSINAFTLQDGYRRYGLVGDSMLIFKTNVINKYRFPIINGEKFFPEAYLYDKVDQHGKLFILRKILYMVEYLPGGYSDQMDKVIKLNPFGYQCFLENRIRYQNRHFLKFFDYIRLVSIMMVNQREKILKKVPLFYYSSIPFGILLYLRRFRTKSL
jgi:glycosyltransferase involved in cell wall biosynthesis